MDKSAIAKKLLALRGNKTREEVAFSLEISVSALTMYETGKRIPRDEIKLRIDQYYDTDLQGIFFDN